MRAAAALVENADAELFSSQDEIEDATEARSRAMRGDTFARLAKALEPAAAIDNELIAQGGGFGIADMIEQAQAAAEKCEQLVLRDIKICREAANGMGQLTRSAPPDIAVREVATGNWYFDDARVARRYAAEVDTARAEIAARKRTLPQQSIG